MLVCSRRLAVAGAVAAVVAVLASAAGAAQSPFRLTMEGHVVPNPRLGILHEGSFTASVPFCPSGTGADLLVTGTRPTVSYRLLSCDDGSGAWTVRLVDGSAERASGRSGSWRVVEGSGAYAELRGMGTLTGVSLQDQSGTPAFRSTWTGVVDFDDVAPPIVLLRTRVTRRPGSPGELLAEAAFTAADDVDGNRVSYRFAAFRSRTVIASRTGDVGAGATSVTLRIDPPQRARFVRLEIEAWDPVGNTRVVARSHELPR